MTSISNGESGLSVRTKLNASLVVTDAFTVSSGNVGIGVTPAAKLDIVTGTARWRVTNDGAGNIQHEVTNSAGAAYSNLTQFANLFAFATSGTERMRIDTSGNVGIGVTPSAWDSGQRAIQINGGGFFASNSSFVRVSANTVYSGAAYKYIQTQEASYYQQGAGTHAWYNAPSGTAGNAVTFTQAMTLDASGNLGIGITSPTNKLHIISTPPATVPAAGTSGHPLAVGTTPYGVAVGVISDGTGYIQSTRWDGTATNYNLSLEPNGGNVGIGTTTPASIGGHTGVLTLFGSNATALALRDSVGGKDIRLNDGLLSITSTGGADQLSIDNSGNVGIGTASPNAASILDAQSTTKGVRFPNMTTTQKALIANVAGNVVFDTTLGKLCVNNGSGWQTITSV